MIRWPRDALIFSVRVRDCGVYAAGYVEGDTMGPEVLGAVRGERGAELVVLRECTLDWQRFDATRRLARGERVARVLDAFLPRSSLQPDSFASQSSSRLVVVEELPGDVHAGDLTRALARFDTVPPAGLALRIARDIAALAATSTPDADGARPLSSRLENALLCWDGVVRMQPRLVSAQERDAVVQIGRNVVRLMTGTNGSQWGYDTRDDHLRERWLLLRSAVPPAVNELVRMCLDSSAPPLAEALGLLDEALVDEPFGAHELAGMLAQVFPEERAQDLEFREDLGACDLDALTLPIVQADEPTPELLARFE